VWRVASSQYIRFQKNPKMGKSLTAGVVCRFFAVYSFLEKPENGQNRAVRL
jgi:hypothetical protein